MEYKYEKDENNAICSNMGGLRDYHIKNSKSERERQCVTSFYVESKI